MKTKDVEKLRDEAKRHIGESEFHPPAEVVELCDDLLAARRDAVNVRCHARNYLSMAYVGHADTGCECLQCELLRKLRANADEPEDG